MNDSPLVFFSVEDARALVAERNRLLRQYEDVNRRVQALAVLVPESMRERIFGSVVTYPSTDPGAGVVQRVGSTSVLRDTIVRLVNEVQQVMDQDEIEQRIWANPEYSDRKKYSELEIAKHLERAARNGLIGKRGTKYYSRNITPDIDVHPSIEGPTIISVAEKVLREADDNLEAWEVIDRLKKDPDLANSDKLRPNAVYAALSRLVARRIAHRDNTGAYRIASK